VPTACNRNGQAALTSAANGSLDSFQRIDCSDLGHLHLVELGMDVVHQEVHGKLKGIVAKLPGPRQKPAWRSPVRSRYASLAYARGIG
jgi:hypothetical protein